MRPPDVTMPVTNCFSSPCRAGACDCAVHLTGPRRDPQGGGSTRLHPAQPSVVADGLSLSARGRVPGDTDCPPIDDHMRTLSDGPNPKGAMVAWAIGRAVAAIETTQSRSQLSVMCLTRRRGLSCCWSLPDPRLFFPNFRSVLPTPSPGTNRGHPVPLPTGAPVR
jgi:hypothetical protein